MAKNLTIFQPGSGRPSPEGVNEWCQITFTNGNGCHQYGPGPRIPNYSGSQATWCVPEGVTKAEFFVRGVGGGTGGICCCMKGSPGNSGRAVIMCPTMTAGDVWQFCMPAGTCCHEASNGQPECALCIYNKTVNGDAGCEYLYLSGPSCAQSFCNWGTCCTVDGETRFDTACGAFTCANAWDSKKNFDNTTRYTCKNCMKYSGTTHTALTDAGLDSDRNLFRSRRGFAIMPCSNAGAIAASCGIQHVIPIQQFQTAKSHYVAMPQMMTPNYTGAGANCNFLKFWTAGANDYGQSGAMCAGGHGGVSGSAEGGNCYCGAQGGPAIVTIRYK
tara:strand:+ start:7950 stop:8939 length:990 start_codon:yes stop_codon:yes gene_type:complete